jgi:uncharacterized metal-binding protein YceD (DUF177 family)
MSKPRPAWRALVRLDDVPDTGRRFDLRADEEARAAVARAAGLSGIERLEASFEVTRHGPGGLHVVGEVSATVRQTCVVSLDPMTNEITESVDLSFGPAAPRSATDDPGAEAHDPPEPLVDRAVDLAAVAVEFLMLGADPYPRKPDAVLQATAGEDGGASPFAALAAFKKSLGGTEG